MLHRNRVVLSPSRHWRGGAVLAACLLASAAPAQESFLVSATRSLEAPNAASSRPSISADGRYVAFQSAASNLVTGDTNSASDVFWRDRYFNVTKRISVSSGGVQGNGASDEASISADGRYVVFRSAASNLTAGDTNNHADVFRHDTESGAVSIVSVSQLAGTQPNAASAWPDVSADGRYVVFTSWASNLVSGDVNEAADVFLRDVQLGVTTLISRPVGGGLANGPSWAARISDDGRFICFATDASNLTIGDTNGVRDVVVWDQVAGAFLPVTANPNTVIATGPSEQCEITPDGEFVVFTSFASNLVSGDTNGFQDVFRWRRSNGAIARASLNFQGAQIMGQSVNPCISADGSKVAFVSFGANVVAGDTNGRSDIFVRSLPGGPVARVSVDGAGVQGNGHSSWPAMSSDGETVAYETLANNLYAGDTNGVADVLAFGERCLGATPYCTAKVNSLGCTPTICSAGSPSLSGPDDFHVTAYRVLNQKSGMLFWGFNPTVAPFFGGTRCVAYPVQRAPLIDSGGSTSGSDCTGAYDFHFTQDYMTGWSLGVGQQLHGQFWSRDPFIAPPNNVGLTDGIVFTILP